MNNIPVFDNVEIDLPAKPNGTRIMQPIFKVNGQEIRNIKELKVEGSANSITEVTVTFYANMVRRNEKV